MYALFVILCAQSNLSLYKYLLFNLLNSTEKNMLYECTETYLILFTNLINSEYITIFIKDIYAFPFRIFC